jgi:myosin heavy subunit
LYHLAEAAYQDMLTDKVNQSIIISGESGSGKTQSTKIILKYLAESSINVSSNSENKDYFPDDNNSIEKQVVNSNPLLEAFGNAKTVKNNNSSRFGKFIQVNFTKNHGKILSAKISHYLLEKSRVVKINDNERSYHIFYLLTKSAIKKLSPQEKKEYYLKDLNHFDLLKHGEKEAEEYEDDVEFDQLLNCMDKLKFSSADKKWIFKTTMGVLYLNNIHFDASDSDGNSPPTISSDCNEDFKIAADLLGFNSTKELYKVFVERTIKDPLGKSITCINTVEMCYNYKENIAKSIYSKMFDFIVKKINVAISNSVSQSQSNVTTNEISEKSPIKSKIAIPKQETVKEKEIESKDTLYIGLLDIFGFENFEHNSFEQLCINYANERLQQFFNLNIFKLEQQEYSAEKIDFSNIEFKDNQEVVELIDSKKHSIFSLLDSQGLMKTGSDKGFREDVYKYLSGKTGLGDNHDGFIEIIHFAENVFYDVEGFIEKNLDQTNKDITVALQNSNNKLIKTLFKKEKDSSGKLLSETLSAQFKKQLNELLITLSQSNPRYVKCIKPNEFKVPEKLNSLDVSCQLLCAGVLEAIKIRKQGYSTRRTHAEFINRYKKLTPSVFNNEKIEINSDSRIIVEKMIKIIGTIPEIKEYFSAEKKLIQIGLTKIFMKEEVKLALENKLNKLKYIEKIQSTWKKYLIKKWIKKLKIIHHYVSSYIKAKKIKRNVKLIKYTNKVTIIIKKSIFSLLIKKYKFLIEKMSSKVQENMVLNNYNTVYNNQTTGNNFKLDENEEVHILGRGKDSARNLTDHSKDDIKKMVNEIKKKKRKTNLGLNIEEVPSGIDKELQSKILHLQEENTMLKKEKEIISTQVKKLNTEYNKVILDNEVLEEKLKLMKESINKLEDNEDFVSKQERLEITGIKKEIAEKDSQIEILTFQLEESRKKVEELNKANASLKNFTTKQKNTLDNQITELVSTNSKLTIELQDLNKKFNLVHEENSLLKDNLIKNNTSCNNFDNISELSILEEESKKKEKERKLLMKKLEDSKIKYQKEIDNYSTEISFKDSKIYELTEKLEKTQEELDTLKDKYAESKNLNNSKYIKSFQEEIEKIKSEYENALKHKENQINELKEDSSQKISNLEKIKLAYKAEIESKDEELAKERLYLEEKQEEIMQLIEKNIELKKQNSLLERQLDSGNKNYIIKLEQDIKTKSNENFLIREKNEESKNYISELKKIVNKKQVIIDNKKNVTNLLLQTLNFKTKEIQCLDALKIMSSKTIEDELKKAKEASSNLIKEINELTMNQDYSGSEGEGEDEEENEDLDLEDYN